jgi:NTE family protein
MNDVSSFDLGRYRLFQGLSSTALTEISADLRTLTFAAGDYVCRQGESGESLFLVQTGLVEVWLETGAEKKLVRRLRQGEVVGEMALLTGEPRSASVVAAVASTVLELDESTFSRIVARHPTIIRNIAVILVERQYADTHVMLRRDRGEAVALIFGPSCRQAAPLVAEATEQASVQEPAIIDLGLGIRATPNRCRETDVSEALVQLETLLHQRERVLIFVEGSQRDLPALLTHVDRVVCLLNATEAARYGDAIGSGLPAELVRVGGGELAPAATSPTYRLVRDVPAPVSDRDLSWLGRHLARAKLGLALGAGGAKGFAHLGVYKVLEEAGFVVDAVAGSSIGSILGSGIAMGMTGEHLSSVAAWLLSPEVCGTYFRLAHVQADAPGHQRFYDALSELAGRRTFAELPIPLAVMTADLNSKRPFVFQSGSLEVALHAALSIPGLAPPLERDNRRLVDGVTIAPVPTSVLPDMGADVTVAVNLMSRDERTHWPGDDSAPVIEKNRSKMLDPMVETLIMLQLDTSTRNAAEADVTITPRFAPSSWRDIHLADRFEAAGRRAAESQLPALLAKVKPQGERSPSWRF